MRFSVLTNGSTLKKATELERVQPSERPRTKTKKLVAEIQDFITHKEWNLLAKEASRTIDRALQPHSSRGRNAEKTQLVQETGQDITRGQQKQEGKDAVRIPVFHIPVKVEPFNGDKYLSLFRGHTAPFYENELYLDYIRLMIQGGFDELLCVNAVTGIQKYWYQIETVRRVLKHFHGRVLLCDEVGLGKTIEAGMLLKEYLMRGMVKNVLILTPAPLVSQWREEMESKFGIEFLTTDDIEFLKNPLSFWKQRFIIASISLAKGSKHMPSVIEQFYDLVIVDEAHHLRNRNTLSWKLVNQIQKKFIFLLTATPVQNNLIELFNLITLLKPGQFKTEKFFKHEYVMRGNLRAPANKERLKELLRDVMVRNTRSAIDLKLPKRFATTVRLEPTETERDIYSGVNEYLRRQSFTKPMLNLLLREAGSSPFALKQSLLTMNRNGDAAHIIDAIDGLGDTCKGEALMRLLENDAGEKKIIFTQFIKSMDYITDLLWRHGIPCTTFRGDMTLREKDLAIARFREEVPVLVSTESGGEGRNLQFCNRLVNFDLPWNPMRIEQRIGRLHRIGQQRDVFVFNLSITGSIEDYIIEILDSKINMFEMVIGEIEPILGQLEEEGDFENLIMEIWLTSSDTEGMKDGFARLGDEIVKAKRKYLDAKAMDSEVLGEDYEA